MLLVKLVKFAKVEHQFTNALILGPGKFLRDLTPKPDVCLTHETTNDYQACISTGKRKNTCKGQQTPRSRSAEVD